jgi:hypothetical protein
MDESPRVFLHLPPVIWLGNGNSCICRWWSHILSLKLGLKMGNTTLYVHFIRQGRWDARGSSNFLDCQKSLEDLTAGIVPKVDFITAKWHAFPTKKSFGLVKVSTPRLIFYMGFTFWGWVKSYEKVSLFLWRNQHPCSSQHQGPFLETCQRLSPSSR